MAEFRCKTRWFSSRACILNYDAIPLTIHVWLVLSKTKQNKTKPCFFGIILYELKPLEKFWIAAENFHLLKDEEMSLFCIQSDTEQSNDKTCRKNPDMPPRSLHPLRGTVWVRSVSHGQCWSLLSSRQSEAASLGSYCTFCSDVGDPWLLGFCASMKLRAIKGMWVAIIVPSTGVVIISSVITTVPGCRHRSLLLHWQGAQDAQAHSLMAAVIVMPIFAPSCISWCRFSTCSC